MTFFGYTIGDWAEVISIIGVGVSAGSWLGVCWQDMTASGQNSGSVDRVTIVGKMSVYSHSGQGFVQAMMNYGNTNSAKYVYINDKTITGKDFNGTDSSCKTVAIVNVYSF